MERARLHIVPASIPGVARHLFASACGIPQQLQFSQDDQKVTNQPARRHEPGSRSSPLDNKYEMLLDAAGFEPVDIDVLAFRTGWSGHTGASMLLLLELQGRIAPQPGGRYCRLS
jgi:predicted Rossmann fold nucleotide-binding protein DprA/Smf involved in DNA uptake